VKHSSSNTDISVRVYLHTVFFLRYRVFPVLCVLLLSVAGCGTIAPVLREPSAGEKIVVRVAVLKSTRRFALVSENAVILENGSTNQLPPRSDVSIEDDFVRIANRQYSYPVRIKSDHPLIIDEKKYYGDLSITQGFVVNRVPLEVYIRGVVASEVAEDWPEEALKAQAVVSRTYVYRKILESSERPYDIEDTELHQKYLYEELSPRIAGAISDTEGLVILYENQPIEAFFHSSSGGITENCGDVFQQDIPYLRAFPDPYSVENEYFLWQYSISGENIVRALDLGNRSSDLYDILIGRKTGSGRVRDFILEFSGKERHIIKGNKLRLILGPKDFKSLFLLSIDNMKKDDELIFTFTGRGYGHGVGMSQFGAREMALRGFSFQQIIAFYYSGSRIDFFQISSND